jgi:hypothetical protein
LVGARREVEERYSDHKDLVELLRFACRDAATCLQLSIQKSGELESIQDGTHKVAVGSVWENKSVGATSLRDLV